MNDFHRLQIVPVKKPEHLRFNLFEFRFFRNSERGVALPFGSNWLLSALIVVPYILSMELILFRAKRYFVVYDENVVGVVAFHEEPDSLFVASLGVAREYRRLGVATHVLSFVEKVAVRLGKEWLELSVLKGNVPARLLYAKLGFEWKMTRRWSYILEKKVGLF